MNTDTAEVSKGKRANFKTLFLLFMFAATYALLTGRIQELCKAAIIIGTCSPLCLCCDRPFLKTIFLGFVIGLTAVIICTVVGLFSGNNRTDVFLYSMFCGTVLLSSFGYILRFMPEKYASRAVSLLFMYVTLATAAA